MLQRSSSFLTRLPYQKLLASSTQPPRLASRRIGRCLNALPLASAQQTKCFSADVTDIGSVLEPTIDNSAASRVEEQKQENVSPTAAENVHVQSRTEAMNDEFTYQEQSWHETLARSNTIVIPDIDYARELPNALRRGDSELAANCVFAAQRSEDGEFIKSLSNADFSSILRLVGPEISLRDLIDIHVYIKNARVNAYGLMPLEQVARECGAKMIRLVDARRQHGGRLLISDYELILGAAKTLRLTTLGQRIWALIQEDGLTLTTKCFNGYLAAVGYLMPIGALSRQHDRYIPSKHKYRQHGSTRWYCAYSVGADGIKEISDRCFTHMQKLGLEPDTESYCNIITACALEGDVSSVSTLLEQLWGFDIAALRSGRAASAPDDFPGSHPLRPNKELMFVGTRAYLVNNDLPTALRLMQYMQQHYAIEADIKQWSLMLEWAHVLSIPRTEKGQDNGKATGKVDPDIVYTIWRVMTSSPYNIEPDIGMCDLMIRSLTSVIRGIRKHSEALEMRARMLEIMDHGRAVYAAAKADRTKWRMVLGILSSGEQQSVSHADGSEGPQEVSAENVLRRFKLAELQCLRDRDMLQSWSFSFLKSSEMHVAEDYDAYMTAVEIPAFISRWVYEVPKQVSYEIPTGYVELTVRSAEDRAWHKRRQTKLNARTRLELDSISGLTVNGWMARQDMSNVAHEMGFAHTRTGKFDDKHKMYRGFQRPEDVLKDVSR